MSGNAAAGEGQSDAPAPDASTAADPDEHDHAWVEVVGGPHEILAIGTWRCEVCGLVWTM